jgi:hypothetical protein
VTYSRKIFCSFISSRSLVQPSSQAGLYICLVMGGPVFFLESHISFPYHIKKNNCNFPPKIYSPNSTKSKPRLIAASHLTTLLNTFYIFSHIFLLIYMNIPPPLSDRQLMKYIPRQGNFSIHENRVSYKFTRKKQQQNYKNCTTNWRKSMSTKGNMTVPGKLVILSNINS